MTPCRAHPLMPSRRLAVAGRTQDCRRLHVTQDCCAYSYSSLTFQCKQAHFCMRMSPLKALFHMCGVRIVFQQRAHCVPARKLRGVSVKAGSGQASAAHAGKRTRRYGHSGPPGRFAPFTPPAPPTEAIKPLWAPGVERLSREVLPLIARDRRPSAAASNPGLDPGFRPSPGRGSPFLNRGAGGDSAGGPRGPGAGARGPWQTRRPPGTSGPVSEGSSRGVHAAAERWGLAAGVARAPRLAGRAWPGGLGLAFARRLASTSAGSVWASVRLGRWL